MLNYAVVGTSNITKEFVQAAAAEDLALAGICSRSAERGAAFAREIAASVPETPRIYEGVDALVGDDGVAAVYVASPNACHFAQCTQMLRAGKHVLCEKPLAVCPAELAQLQALASDHGLVLMEAIMYLHTPMRRALLEALPGLGRVTGVHFDFSQRSSRLDRLLAGELPNIFDPAMRAGAFNDLGVYCVYPLLDFFGEPEALCASVLRHGYDGAADTSGAALLRYADFDAALTWSKAGQSRGVSQIMGEKGTLCIRSISQFQGITYYDNEGNTTILDSPMTKPEVMCFEARAFMHACANETPDSGVSYAEASALAMQTARWMDVIRKGVPQ